MAVSGRGVKGGTLNAIQHLWAPLEMVISFRYLGRMISVTDDDWLAVIRNMEKARAVWRRMMRIPSIEGARLRESGFFFKGVVQLVLIFGEET